MSFYTPNVDDLEKLKKIINQKRDIKKQRLNRKIQKAAFFYVLAEQYAPITQLQEKQIKRQEDHTRSIEDQTRTLEAITTPAIKSPLSEDLEVDENEENLPIRAIDADISDMISCLLNQVNTHPQMRFSKPDLNNYKVNGKPFELYDNKLEFNNISKRFSHNFFIIFTKGNTLSINIFTQEEMNHLNDFVDYAGGLERDTRSNLYKVLKSFKDSLIHGDGTSFIFLSSDPNVLVVRFEVLVGESLALIESLG